MACFVINVKTAARVISSPASSRPVGCVCDTAVVRRVSCNSRPLRTLFRGGDIVSVGYAIAHPRLNPVGRMPPGARPSDVHSDDGFIMVMDAMTCEACEAETQARLVARGKRSATPGYHHPPPTRHPYRMRII